MARPARNLRHRALAQLAIATGACVALCACSPAAAQVSGSITVGSDYRYRGVSLSNQDPSAQGTVNFDSSSGAYAGAFAASARLGPDSPAVMHWMHYAGMAARVGAGITLDAGADYSAFTGSSRLGFTQVHGGLSTEDFAARVFYAPNYFQSGARAAYAQLEGGMRITGPWRWFAGAGALDLVSVPAGGGYGPRHQFDYRGGIAAAWAAAVVRLSWGSTTRYAAVYPLEGYDENYGQHRGAWVLQVLALF